jgi:uncharacterized protein
MRIDSEFTVKAPIEVVWSFLLDVERIAPCMPGAQLTEVVDDHTWKGKTSIKVGPVALSFAGTVELKERDDSAHRAVLKAQGMEQKGKGAASASVVSYLQEVDGGTKVVMETDLTISGAVAQYGRGMIQDISQRLTNEFAQCLETNLTAEGVSAASTQEAAEGAPAEPLAAVARPVKGLRLGAWAFWRAVVRFFKRLFGVRPA